MGYGKRALKLLKNYYAGKFAQLDENVKIDDDESDDQGNIFMIAKFIFKKLSGCKL